jgi:hypothetical protein
MTRTLGVVAFIVVLGAPVPAQSQSAADPGQTMGAALAGIQSDVAKMIADYCVGAAPTLKPQLETQLEHFTKVSAEAVKPILERLSRDPEFNAPEPANFREELKTVREMMLQEIKKQDPNVYCQGFVDKMSSVKAEDLRAAIESAVAGYLAAAKQQGE